VQQFQVHTPKEKFARLSQSLSLPLVDKRAAFSGRSTRSARRGRGSGERLITLKSVFNLCITGNVWRRARQDIKNGKFDLD